MTPAALKSKARTLIESVVDCHGDTPVSELTAFVDALIGCAEVLKDLRSDEWRCTVDWGPRNEREAINVRSDAALSRLEELAK